jgi:Fe-S cluster assembly ATPase SufC
MLYKFKSKTTGDLIMLEPSGRRVLEVIGKEPGRTGIILSGQMPAAIQALQAAIALEESTQQVAHTDDHDTDNEGLRGDVPGLRRRAGPFIEMLERNYKAQSDVVWGV